MGWKVVNRLPYIPDKCVFCVAPHTSNWDFVIGKICYTSLGRDLSPKFLIKKEWTRFPFGLIMNPLGAIGVDRGRRNNLTDEVIGQMEKADRFQLAITPEGTRKLNPVWKRGFYAIAQKANVPLVIVALDYGRKQLVLDHFFEISGDVAADVEIIRDWYHKNVLSAKYPEKFT